MARLELTGGFGEGSAKQFDTQRCSNMYPVYSSTNGGKGSVKLVNNQGYNVLSSDELAGFNVALLFTININDQAYFIYSVGNSSIRTLYVIGFDKDGNTFTAGKLVSASPAIITKARGAFNGRVLCIVTDVGEAFYFDPSEPDELLSIVQITDPDFPVAVFDVVYKDTYFIWLDSATDRFYISESYSEDPANCVNSLDFGTIESNPDPIKGVIGVGNEIAIFGSETIEYFYNSGDVDFPFERNSGVTQEIGLLNRESLNKINNEIYFLGSNQSGYGIIYRLNGYKPERISTNAIEESIASFVNESVYSYTYKGVGGYFYVIRFEESRISYQYNVTNGLWSEISNPQNDDDKYYYTVKNHVFAYNKNMFVDMWSVDPFGYFVIAELSEDYYKYTYIDKNLGVLHEYNVNRLVETRHITSENKNIQYNYFEMDIQKGVGNVDDPDPEITLSISRDGGMTYGKPITLKMGKSGSYKQRVRADMLGTARDAVFKLESSSPVQQEWFSAYIDYEVMSE